jgi:hypothetical protein
MGKLFTEEAYRHSLSELLRAGGRCGVDTAKSYEGGGFAGACAASALLLDADVDVDVD